MKRFLSRTFTKTRLAVGLCAVLVVYWHVMRPTNEWDRQQTGGARHPLVDTRECATISTHCWEERAWSEDAASVDVGRHYSLALLSAVLVSIEKHIQVVVLATRKTKSREATILKDLLSGELRVICTFPGNDEAVVEGRAVELHSEGVLALACRVPVALGCCVESRLAGQTAARMKACVEMSLSIVKKDEDAPKGKKVDFRYVKACHQQVWTARTFSMATIVEPNDGMLAFQWLNYHHVLNIEHLYIYSVGSHARLKEIVEKLNMEDLATVVTLPQDINTIWSGDTHYVKNMVWNAARVDSIYRLHHHTRWLLFTRIEEYLFMKAGNESLQSRPVADRIGLETASDSPALIMIPRAVFARADSGRSLVRGQRNNGTVVVASSVMRCQTKDKAAHIWRVDRMTAFWRDGAQTSTTTQMNIGRRRRNEARLNDYTGTVDCSFSVFDMSSLAFLEEVYKSSQRLQNRIAL